MKIYIFDFNEFERGAHTYDASLKPRKDTVSILKKNKISVLKPLYFSFSGSKNKFITNFKKLWNHMSLRIQFCLGRFKKKNAIIFIQYPIYPLEDMDFEFVMRYFIKRNNKLVFFIHDLNSIRYTNISYNDKLLFKYADCCIFHSQNMIEKCRDLGYDKECCSLEFFDYLSDIQNQSQKSLRNIKLIFAGNLNKSKFLEELEICRFNSSFQLFLYGNENKNINYSDNIIYKGKFNPDDISKIEGNWGLVWDGECCNTCNGQLGEYLKYNAPFKFSLYIASNRPVIVWKKSAMAEYVDKYNLGITVGSIYEIPHIINKMTDSQLNEIIQAVNAISNDVRNGIKLTSVVSKISKHYNNRLID